MQTLIQEVRLGEVDWGCISDSLPGDADLLARRVAVIRGSLERPLQSGYQ